MKSISYPLRIDERIIELVNLKSKDEYIDKSTALRKLLYQGVEDYVIELYIESRLSIGKVAEILGKSIYDVHKLLIKRGVKIEHDEKIISASEKTAKKIIGR